MTSTRKRAKSLVAKNLVNYVLEPLGVSYPGYYLRYLDDDKYVHYLHIGRNAGTTIKEFNSRVSELTPIKIMSHEHKISLSDIPPKADYFFSIRDPIERFYSAFYWRRRRRDEAALSDVDSYSDQERKAFTRFREANDLAENLFADGEVGLNAFAAMQEIKHIMRPQHSWFPTVEEVFVRRPPLAIVRLKKMREDLNFLAAKFQLDLDAIWREREVQHHQNNYADKPPLSPRAIENLKRWYATDFQFYEMANSWIAQNQEGRTRPPAAAKTMASEAARP